MQVAKKLQTELKKQGCKVILTRKDNKIAISCAQRAQKANKAKAEIVAKKKAELAAAEAAKQAEEAAAAAPAEEAPAAESAE